MNLKGVENLVLAVASELKNPEYIEEILNMSSFIQPFMAWRSKQLERREETGELDPGVFDDLCDYIMTEHAATSISNENFSEAVRSNKGRILSNYMRMSRSELVTAIAAQNYALDIVTRQILKSNLARSKSDLIKSHVGIIKDMFLAQFQAESAHAFQFGGTLVAFVAYSFLNYFWKPHKSEIWRKLNSADALRLETEWNISQTVELETEVWDDLKIRDLVQNMYTASEKMFSHSGWSTESRGILCDIYYIVMSILCRKKIQHLNEQLALDGCEFRVKYCNVYSYAQDTALQQIGVEPFTVMNKGMTSKVTNATEIVELIVDAIIERKISKESLFDLCYACFNSGKRDIEGKNSMWRSLDGSKATVTKLTEEKAIINFATFDIILKGTMCAYTYMTKLQERGKCVASEYVVALFRDPDIVRSVSYYSDVAYIPLIYDLLDQISAKDPGGGLLTMGDLISEIIGSVQNGHGDIRDNRKLAQYQGLLDNPRKKKAQGTYATKYDEVASYAGALTALPREFVEDKHIADMIENDSIFDGQIPEHAPLTTSYIMASGYANVEHNIFLIEHPDMAEILLCYNKKEDKALPHLNRWNVATTGCNGIYYCANGTLELMGVFNPRTQMYIFEQATDTGTRELFGIRQEDFLQMYNSNRNTRAQVIVLYSRVSFKDAKLGFSKYLVSAKNANAQLDHAFGFDTYLGVENVDSQTVLENLKKLNMSKRYIQQILQYSHEYGELSKIQISLCNVAQLLFMDASCGMYDSSQPKVAARSYQLFESFLQNRFDAENLNDALQRLWTDYKANAYCFRTYAQGVGGQFFSQDIMDMQALEWVFGKHKLPKNIRYKLKSEVCEVVSVYCDLEEIVQEISATKGVQISLAGRFILLHNYVDNRIRMLRYLRDGAEILFLLNRSSLSTLTCSLDYILHISETISNTLRKCDKVSASLNTIRDNEMEDFILKTCKASYNRYLESFNAILDYTESCAQDLSGLLEYNIVTGSSISQDLKEWGEGFRIQPEVPGARELIPAYLDSTDAVGFYRHGGSYVKATIKGDHYFIHCSGHILRERNGKFEPVDFDLSKIEDKNLYNRIIGVAVSNFQ